MALTLTNSFTGNVDDSDSPTLELNGASSITAFVFGGKTFLGVGGSVDNGLSLFEIGVTGALSFAQESVDDGEGRLHLVTQGTGPRSLAGLWTFAASFGRKQRLKAENCARVQADFALVQAE